MAHSDETGGGEMKALSDIRITGVSAVTSYSFLDNEEPTISVPDRPALWRKPTPPPELVPDQGTQIINQDAYRSPKSPMEPAIRAVLHQDPAFDFLGCNIIADRHALSDIFDPSLAAKRNRTYSAQIVGNIVVFVRDEPNPVEVIKSNRFCGFRRDVERKYLEIVGDAASSQSHYRIITYHLGELQILLRYGADGHFVDPEEAPQGAASHTSSDKLVINVSESPEMQTTPVTKPVPQSDIFELTTSTKCWDEEQYVASKVPDLWLSQTPYLVKVKPYIVRSSRSYSDKRAKVWDHNIDFRDAAKDAADFEANHQEKIKSFYDRL